MNGPEAAATQAAADRRGHPARWHLLDEARRLGFGFWPQNGCPQADQAMSAVGTVLGWWQVFPVGLATAMCVTGLSVFSGILFSQQIVSSDSDYGSIGVVMVLLSYLIGLGVCIHLGAVAGRMWDERRSEPTADPEELPAAVDR